MTRRNLLILSGVAVALLASGVWFDARREGRQSDIAGVVVFADLKPALAEIGEIRLSKGDGSRTTLRRGADGWQVVERNYPADVGRVREFALALAELKIIERKTSDPANYSKLGVEAPDAPTATSTLVEVVAGPKTWSLIVGKGADGRTAYVRKPSEAASALVTPVITADPDQKRWIDRQLADLPGAEIHDIEVRPANGPAYRLARAKRGDPDLALSPVPKGRSTVSSMSLNSQGEVLASFLFDDVHARSETSAAMDRAIWRTFDGQVIEFTGRRTADKAFVSLSVRRDAALASQFATPAPAAATPGPGTQPSAVPAAETSSSAKTVERLSSRVAGVEFAIPSYKYDALFKPLEELLEKPPGK